MNTTLSVKAVDSDNTITDPDWFGQASDAGIRLYIMASTAWGTCDPWDRALKQLKMALDAGLAIAVYTRDPSCWPAGIRATGPYREQLQFFALDVETGGPGVTRAMVDGVRSMGVRPVVYSGAGMWPPLMHDSTEFCDVPLWDTDTGDAGIRDFDTRDFDTQDFDFSGWTADHLSPPPMAYGGWNSASTMRIGVQQRFEHRLNGVNVDLNSFDVRFLRR